MTTDDQHAAWMEISRDDFLEAIGGLGIRRASKTNLLRTLEIGMFDNHAVFCLAGIETRCPARGDWNGYARVAYRVVHAFFKVPPARDPVRLSFSGERLRIVTMSVSAQWVGVSGWIGRIAMEAHFTADDDTARDRRYCPACGKKKSIRIADRKSAATPAGPATAVAPRSRPTHSCAICGYGWVELGPDDPIARNGQPKLA